MERTQEELLELARQADERKAKRQKYITKVNNAYDKEKRSRAGKLRVTKRWEKVRADKLRTQN